MTVTIGIRREDKNEWERRVPFIPADLAALQSRCGLRFLVQPSPIRVFKDGEYAASGVTLSEDLSSAPLILAIKEIPTELLLPGRVYVCFAHVAKGQAYNMPMLQRYLELGCSLLDYEKITDESNRRLIFFGRHAGYAGMVETLRCLGQRLAAKGLQTPLVHVRHAYAYKDLENAKAHLSDLGKQILRVGLPREIRPMVFGFTGYGNVSHGAQEVLDCLRVREIGVSALRAETGITPEWGEIIKVVFREENTVQPLDPAASFNLQEYYRNPERYRSCFEAHLPHLDVLVNAIYWEERYPRLVTREWARRAYAPESNPRLKVIGDISCDIEGSIEITAKITKPDNPCYVFEPATGTVQDGVYGDGPVIMAVDNLPCEFPKESSEYFSAVLREMACDLAAADWSAGFDVLNLPPHLKKALIVHRGALTPAYRYLQEHLDRYEQSAGRQ
ncbi:MAG: alanine dehydrogenase/PNT domain protein [Acidobacteria bacterium]|nr:alanine dehydrogenase/PNT domain protein [Acidobacteriota bacterium]